jgi:hypothetical protein
MLEERYDYVMRHVQHLAQFVARIIALTEQRAWAELAPTLEQAYKTLLGVDKALLDCVDAESARLLLDSTEKITVWAKLLQQEAAAAEAQGDHATAERLRYKSQTLSAT